MALESQQSVVTYRDTGASISYTVPFPVLDKSHLRIWLRSPDGTLSSLVEGGDYSVHFLDKERSANIELAQPLPADRELVVQRTVPITQESIFFNQGPNSPKITEDALDKLTMICQELEQRIAGCPTDESLREVERLVTALDARIDDAMPAAPEQGQWLASGNTWADFQAIVTEHLVSPTHYSRTEDWRGLPLSLVPPKYITARVGNRSFRLLNARPIDLSTPQNWDVPAWTTASARAGKDFYIFLHVDSSGDAAWVLSNNSTVPAGSGFTESNTRKVGGFHCLCVDVGTISSHPLSGLTAGQILPASVWDLRHRPVANPEGMVYSGQTGKWYQIYMTNPAGGSSFRSQALVHANGPDVHGLTKGSQLWYAAFLAQYGLSMLTDREFLIVSLGSNRGTNSSSGMAVLITGGHFDTAGRRMISNIGLEDCCGFLWHILDESVSISTSAINGSTEYTAIDGGNGGHYGTGRILAAGGRFDSGANAGPAARHTMYTAWTRVVDGGTRGCSEPLLR